MLILVPCGRRRQRVLSAQMSVRLQFAALAALLIIISGCGTAGSDPPPLYVAGAPSYVQADGSSCISLSLETVRGIIPVPMPGLSSNLGTVKDLRPTPGGWTAEVCSGTETGRIHLEAPGYKVITAEPLYFVPPEYWPPSGSVAVMSFSLQIDSIAQTVAFSSTAVLNADSIGISASLGANPPFTFQGDTVEIGLRLVGDQIPFDLYDVRIEIDAISDPGAKVLGNNGQVEETGDAPYYDCGSCISTSRAMDEYGEPAQGTLDLGFKLASPGAVYVTGTVLATPTFPNDREAGFSIRPYLTRAREHSITVIWKTDHESRSFVVYGPTPDCDLVAVGSVRRDTFILNWDGTSALYFNSFLHRVEISGLEPDAKYYYRIIAVDHPTPPEPFFTAGRALTTLSFGVLSDTQKGYDAHTALISRMLTQNIRFLLVAGDLVQLGSSEQDWLDFFSAEAPLIKSVPIFPAPGNHDQYGFDDFFARYFPADSEDPAPPELRGHAYSFDYGPCHFISLDVNLNIEPGYPEYEWLVSDLAASGQDPLRKFTVVFLHYPPISGFAYAYYPDGLDYWVPLFAASGVDAVFSGHVHIYERSDVNGAVYITCGSGGGDLRYWYPDPTLNPYEQIYHFGHGLIRVDVTSDSMDFYDYDEQGTQIDHFHYIKP